jgi:Lectin C-type domain
LRTILLLTLAACDFHATAPGTTPGGVDSGVGTVDASPPDGTSFTPCTGYLSLGVALEPSSYRVVTARTRFKDAELSCEAGKGHLVILDSTVEATAVALASVNGWVGLSDLKNEGTWSDVAGQPSPYMVDHWALNEPSTGGSDNCAFQDAAGNLHATNCGNQDGADGDTRAYVCECGDGVQGNPKTFQRPSQD